jgi:transposase InsO family protein
MTNQTKKWIRACLPCCQRKRARPKNVVKPGRIKPPTAPMQTIVIDFSGPYPTTKRSNKWILGIVCPFSRYPICIPLPSRKASVLTRALIEHVFQYFSPPQIIVTDNGQELIGKEMKRLCRLFGIQHIRTKPYTPQLNPYIERFWRYLTAAMTITTSRFKNEWDDTLPHICMKYRTSTCESTGYSPYQVMFGREPNLPDDGLFDSPDEPAKSESEYIDRLEQALQLIHDDVRNRTDKAALKNLQRRTKLYRHVKYDVGDFCLVWAPSSAERLPEGFMVKPKLMDRWSLPHRIVATGDRPDHYIIEDHTGQLTDVRADSMTPYTFFTDNKPSVPPRRKFTTEERRILRRSGGYLPPKLEKGAFAVFPLTINDKHSFGVGKVVGLNAQRGGFDLHWYSNDTDNVLGSYQPVWTKAEQKWYTGDQKEKQAHKPMLTSEYYHKAIRQQDIADAGFQLLDDGRLPYDVLRHIHDHKDYKWKLPKEMLDPHDNPMITV